MHFECKKDMPYTNKIWGVFTMSVVEKSVHIIRRPYSKLGYSVQKLTHWPWQIVEILN